LSVGSADFHACKAAPFERPALPLSRKCEFADAAMRLLEMPHVAGVRLEAIGKAGLARI